MNKIISLTNYPDFLFSVVFLVLISCSEKSEEESQSPQKPNILFIFTNDHAFQAISAYQERLAELAPTKI